MTLKKKKKKKKKKKLDHDHSKYITTQEFNKLTENNFVGYTKPCSHSFLLTPTHFHSFLTHFRSFPAHSHPLPLMFSSLLLILNRPLPMCSLSHLFSVHIQILSPNPNHHLQLEPMFSPSVLHAYISFNINLFFLLFSVLF